ncbi:MAG: ABC transporter ATP-binding protein [Spirochaetales bacterium]|nr:ABC transporter ATP-binding protein [Spirochaetales bacterium]
MDEIVIDDITFSYPDTSQPVFKNLSLTLPRGVTSFAGQNGTGKSTLLLLAGGILLPREGRVLIQTIDTQYLRDEKKRQQYVSFIYQNMEFETEENIDSLLHYVYENGFHEKKEDSFIIDLVKVFELEPVLNKKTQEISKGELQRTILVFSLLYGSKIIIMDEPVFAMEQYQKEQAMNFFIDYSKKTGTSILYSVHELDITVKFSGFLLLFYKNGQIRLGPTSKLFTKDNLEEAYQIPYNMLKTKESIYRELLEKRIYPV